MGEPRPLSPLAAGIAEICREGYAKHRAMLDGVKATLLDRYGSAAAASAPCEREKLLIEATKPLAKVIRRRFANGVFDQEALAGWCHRMDKMPAKLRAAVIAAYPAPLTIREARAESIYWEQRSTELESLTQFDSDDYLSLPALARADVIGQLYRYDMPIRTKDDMLVRLELLADGYEWLDVKRVANSLLAGFREVSHG